MSRFPFRLAALAAAVAGFSLSGALAAPPTDGAGVTRVDLSTSAPGSRALALGKGKSALVELPVDARDVTVTNPAVADVVLRTPRRISILGLSNGQTDAVFFDGMGRQILSLDVRVDQDASAVAQTIARVIPTSKVSVQSVNNSLVLTGQVLNAADADRAQQIAAQFVANPSMVLNMLSIAGSQQVMLKVRVVEVQRTAIKQLGFNLGAVFGKVGGTQWGGALTPTYGVNGNLIGGLNAGLSRDTTQQPLLAGPDDCGKTTTIDLVNAAACVGENRAGVAGWNQAISKIQAFERAGLVRTLAEPNLTAVSGESAKFLVGGEFPVPIGQDTQGRVTVEFKPFGVSLNFTPVVMSDGRISLKLETEVSELTSEGAFSLSNGPNAPALVVPALAVRRASTTVEMPSGGAMMIAGLLQEQTRQNIDSLPGLMNLPVLGALFRSRDYLSGQTELVVIVTPYLVDPTRPDQLQTPADGLQIANDAQTILMGQLAHAYKVAPQATAGRTYQGPYGYVIE